MKDSNTYRDSHKVPGKGTSYDENFNKKHLLKFVWQREQDILIQIINDFFTNNEIHLLDFACGTGRITKYLEGKVSSSTGVDVSEPMLKIARKKLQSTKLVKTDLTKNNVLSGEKYNLITAFRFFLNAEPNLRIDALRVIVSMLSDDGIFIFNNHQNWAAPSVKLKYLYSKITKNEKFNIVKISDMRNLLNEFGLVITQIYPVGYLNAIKIELPNKWRQNIENILSKTRCLRHYSESPIIVCKHK